jgi:OOP family OmpA-OmpF porin
MNRVIKGFLVWVSVISLTGCVGTQLEKAQRVSPEGSAFNVSLYQEYIDLASSEYNEGDYRDSDNFAVRAMQSGSGGTVAPEEISARRLPEDKVGELTSARQRLVGTLSKGAAEKVPAETARAQTGFDCWMQEQEENFQPDDIEACRSRFFAALEYIEDALKPKPIAKKVEPPAAPPPEAQTFVLYFGTDGDELDKASQAVLSRVRAAASKIDGAKITVAGFTDAEGTSKYNLGLSDRRAETVALALADAAAQKIDTISFGQHNQAVPTADGVEEPLNRRVEITVSP